MYGLSPLAFIVIDHPLLTILALYGCVVASSVIKTIRGSWYE